jgi:hypothetical protein
MRAQKMPKPDGWAWWQVVWANIWDAVLAVKVALYLRGPVVRGAGAGGAAVALAVALMFDYTQMLIFEAFSSLSKPRPQPGFCSAANSR